jgi:flagellar P-ring protein precursor FlgI
MATYKAFLKLLVFIIVLSYGTGAYATDVRIGDITNVRGVRQNQLVGYGLVAGLAGTGDGTNAKFTIQSIINMLRRFNINLPPALTASLQTKNIAAVMVTANLPPFIKEGSRINVNVASIGDAKSLQGGTLLMTPLIGANGNVYAVAQGPLSIGGFSFGTAGGNVRQNFPTTAIIPDGALVERQVEVDLSGMDKLYFDLNHPDFTMANRIQQAINSHFKQYIAHANDSGSVIVDVPDFYKGDIVGFVSAINQLTVENEVKPKVVIDERTGTVVIGGNVTINPVSVSHGNLTVTISPNKQVSQPAPLSAGQTTVTQNPTITVNQEQSHFLNFYKGATVKDLVNGLNKAGATPNDIIAILEALKQAGSLNASLEVM